MSRFLANMLELKKGDVRSCVRWLMIPSAGLGLCPIVSDDFLTYRPSLIRTVSSTIMCLLFYVKAAYMCCSEITVLENVKLTFEISCLDSVLMASISSMAVFELLCHLHCLNQCILELHEVEAALQSLGRKMEYHIDRWSMYARCAVMMVALIMRIVKNAAEGVDMINTIYESAYWFILMAQIIVLTQWMTGFLGLVAALLSSSNQEIIHSHKSFALFKTKKLEQLVWIQNTLCLCLSRFNEANNLQIVLLLTTCYMLSVTEAYMMLSILTPPIDPIIYFPVIVKLCWISVPFSICLGIVSAFNRCAIEAREFNTLLYQLMIDDKTNDISNNKKLRLHIAMKREVVFTACGFFNLDYTLVHSMIAAATTYLVILIQFGQPSSSNSTTEVSSTNSIFENATEIATITTPT